MRTLPVIPKRYDFTVCVVLILNALNFTINEKKKVEEKLELAHEGNLED
jgi:hypothetical protein